jgi:oligopeptidase B
VQGDAIVDEYAWLEDTTNPEVIVYLEAENRYTQEVLAPARPLEERAEEYGFLICALDRASG